MNSLILVGLLAVVAKNLVELLKHFANVGGSEDSTYTRRKGVYAFLAPVLLAALAYVAQNQGASLDLLGSLGVNTDSPAIAAILSGIVAGFAAPEAYDVQNLLKGKARISGATADAIVASNPQA